jgi:hypothetical protein
MEGQAEKTGKAGGIGVDQKSDEFVADGANVERFGTESAGPCWFQGRNRFPRVSSGRIGGRRKSRLALPGRSLKMRPVRQIRESFRLPAAGQTQILAAASAWAERNRTPADADHAVKPAKPGQRAITAPSRVHGAPPVPQRVADFPGTRKPATRTAVEPCSPAR